MLKGYFDHLVPTLGVECGTLDALRHSLETSGNERALTGDRVHQRTRKAASLIPVERGLNIFGRFRNWLKELLRKKPGPPTGTGGLKLPWLSWEQYPKVTIGGQEYARVGNRL